MDFEEKALKLVVERDKMYADLVCCLSEDVADSFMSFGAAQEALKSAGVIFNVDLEKVRETTENIEQMNRDERICVAEGREPTFGKDGYIDFKVDVSGKAVYKVDESTNEKVDFKNATKVVCVQAGEILAEIVPPIPGNPGKTVLGENIPASRPKDASLRAGINVESNSDNTTFKASQSGKPVFSDGIISVLPVYEVPGDVDYNTGHIEFDGSVIINGSVLDDFNVKAKEVTVLGTVGAAEIISDTNITVSGGITGKDKARLIAGGNVKIKYANNAYIECLGDVFAQREIVNSNISTNGRVFVGNLIGGITTAKLGIEANSIGSDLGVATRVEPGVDLEVRKIEKVMAQIDEKIFLTVKPVTLFFGEKQKFRSLPEEKKIEIKQEYEKFKMLHTAHIKLAERKKQLTNKESVPPIKEVIVRKNICPDTIITTDLCMRNFSKPLTGPIKVVEDVDHSTMAVRGVSDKDDGLV